MPDDWQDCFRILPYRDYLGRMVWLPRYTQKRKVIIDDRLAWQYRERPETDDEWESKQW